MKLNGYFSILFFLLFTQTAFSQWTGFPGYVPQDFDYIYFRNSQLGFAATFKGYLYKTVNGGANWSEILRPNELTGFEQFKVRDFWFTSDNRGFFVGYDFWEANYLILETNDGGETWDYISYERSLNVVGGCNRIVFPTPFTGYIVGDKGQLFKTVDGGLNWQPSIVAGASSADLIDMDFVNDQIGYTMSNNFLYKTVNGGSSWTNTLFPYPMKQIFFFTEQNGYAIGDNGLYKTTNGGQGWTFVSKPSNGGTNIPASFLNENVGYLLAEAMFKTVDGGQHWFTQEYNPGLPAGISGYINDLYMLDEQTGWLGGGRILSNGNYGSLVLKTGNGGGMGLDCTLSKTQLTCPGDSVTASATWLGNPQSFSWYLDDTLKYTGAGPHTFYNLAAGSRTIKVEATSGTSKVSVKKTVSVPYILSFFNYTFTISTPPCQGVPAQVNTNWNDPNDTRLLMFQGNTFIDTVVIQTQGSTKFFMLPPVNTPTTFRFEAAYQCASGIPVGQVTVTPKLLPATNLPVTTTQNVYCEIQRKIPVSIGGTLSSTSYKVYQDNKQIDSFFGNGGTKTFDSDSILNAETRFWVEASVNGCQDTLQDTLLVRIDFTDARFAVNGMNMPVGTPVDVVFKGLEATAYQWDFGQGAMPATSTDKVPGTITYSGEQTTRIQLITDGYYGCRDTVVKYLALYTPTDIGEFWAQDMDQAMNQQGYLAINNVAVDQDGGIFIHGYSLKTAAIPSRAGTGTIAEPGVGLMKYDRYGVLQWFVHTDGNPMTPIDLKVDATGDVMVLYNVYNYQQGYSHVYVGSTDENRRKLVLGKKTVIGKWDTDGKLKWMLELKSCIQAGVTPYDIELDAAGNIYLMAKQDYSAQCTVNELICVNGNSTQTFPVTRYFIAKISPAGLVQWVHPFSNPTGGAVLSAWSMTVDPQGNVIVGGGGAGYPILTKYDPSGAVLWSNTPLAASPTPYYKANYVTADETGNIYISGEYRGRLDFGNLFIITTPNNNLYNQFVLKMNPSGQVQWIVPMYSAFNITPGGMALHDGDLYVASTFNYRFEVPPLILENVNGIDNTGAIWLQMTQEKGALKFYTVLNQTPSITTTQYSARGNSIFVDDEGVIYLSGKNGYKMNLSDTLLQTPNNKFIAKIRNLDNVVPAVEPASLPQLSASVTPNPGKGAATLQLDLETNQRISCQLVNLQGQATTLWEGIELPAGHSDIPLDAVPAGVYFLHLSDERGATAVLKWVVVE